MVNPYYRLPRASVKRLHLAHVSLHALPSDHRMTHDGPTLYRMLESVMDLGSAAKLASAARRLRIHGKSARHEGTRSSRGSSCCTSFSRRRRPERDTRSTPIASTTPRRSAVAADARDFIAKGEYNPLDYFKPSWLDWRVRIGADPMQIVFDFLLLWRSMCVIIGALAR